MKKAKLLLLSLLLLTSVLSHADVYYGQTIGERLQTGCEVKKPDAINIDKDSITYESEVDYSYATGTTDPKVNNDYFESLKKSFPSLSRYEYCKINKGTLIKSGYTVVEILNLIEKYIDSDDSLTIWETLDGNIEIDIEVSDSGRSVGKDQTENKEDKKQASRATIE